MREACVFRLLYRKIRICNAVNDVIGDGADSAVTGIIAQPQRNFLANRER